MPRRVKSGKRTPARLLLRFPPHEREDDQPDQRQHEHGEERREDEKLADPDTQHGVSIPEAFRRVN